jgi:hypothetical protein
MDHRESINMEKFWVAYHKSIAKSRKHYDLETRLYSIDKLINKYKKNVILDMSTDFITHPSREALIDRLLDMGCELAL